MTEEDMKNLIIMSSSLSNNVYNAVIKELALASFDTFGNIKVTKKIQQLSDEFIEKLIKELLDE